MAEQELRRALHEALVRKRVSRTALRELLARKGTEALAALLPEAGLPTRSVGERDLLNFLREAELDLPDATNVVLAGRERDAVWHDLELVVEFDGAAVLHAIGYHPVHVTSEMLGTKRLVTAAAFGALMAERRAAVAATRAGRAA